jgi:SAM-dependent methyltransferase
MDMGFENSIGIDKSNAMIKKAKENYPNYNFMRGDVLNALTFQRDSFTHILCLYFSIYYMKNKQLFFNNCYNWLLPGGYLVVHLVDRNKFDPILPPSNPLYLVSPQRYAKNRITTSKVSFNDFEYQANFVLNENNDTAKFVEKFTSKNGNKKRRQEHIMYMETTHYILQLAQTSGFIISGQVDLLNVSYEYQYLYILQKPE